MTSPGYLQVFSMETVKIVEKKSNLEKNKILGKHWPQCLFLMSKNIDFEIGELYYLQHSSSKCHPVVTTPVSSSSLVCVSHSHTPVNILSFAMFPSLLYCDDCFIVNVDNVDLKHLSGTGNHLCLRCWKGM